MLDKINAVLMTFLIVIIALTGLNLLLNLYEMKWLNFMLPSCYQKSGFRGAYGRSRTMEQCLSGDPKNPVNMCTWV